MKKVITSTFLLFTLLLSSCNTDNTSSCDPDFEVCTTSQEESITLKSYSTTNYEYDNNITNENGSASYEIFVRSFYDTNNDGIGDFNGINQKLSYLSDLGIKTIWLMPIHPSPSYHGYDVTNYYDVNSDYGTLDDFKNLISNAAAYNIDIMIDIVFNHSSSQHEWFLQSYEDYISNNTQEDSKKDWYNWSETSKSGYNVYGNTGLYYESRFDYAMPDFNTKNQYVRNEMIKILDYWIDLGVKGFRLDAVKYYDYENTTYNVEFLTYLKNNIKDSNIYFVGECFDGISKINEYYKSTIDSFFKFNASLNGSGQDSILAQVKSLRTANVFGSLIQEQETLLKQYNSNGYSSYFLSNHDMDRPTLGDSYTKMAASLYLLLPGTPFIYYGEEIGLKGTRNTSPDDQTDALRRLPLIWSKDDKTGECDFPDKDHLSLKNSYTQVSKGVNDLLNENYSLVNHYKKVLNIRNKYSFIKYSYFLNLTSLVKDKYDHVLIYKLYFDNEQIILVHNFATTNVSFDVSNLNISNIDEEISVKKLIPELNNNTLKLGGLSTVILK